jgi:hypothetical protein
MQLDAYLSEKQKKRKKKRKYFLIAATLTASYLLLMAAFWLFLRSPFFRVDHMVVAGNATVPADAVATLLQSSVLRDHGFWKSLAGSRNMLVWPGELSSSDLQMIPQLAVVTLSRDYFSHTITATAVERTPFAIWCLVSAANGSVLDERCYWFDGQGIAFAKTFDTQGSLMFAIHDYSQDHVGLNTTVLPEPFVANLISVIDAVKQSGVDVKEIALRDLSLQELTVTTYDGPSLYFSLRFSAANDLPVLQSLMAKPNFKNLQYVDFRVENRAYYK